MIFDLFKKDEKSMQLELESLKKAQEALNERFEKKQINNDFFVQKSLEYRNKIEKLEKKLNIEKY